MTTQIRLRTEVTRKAFAGQWLYSTPCSWCRSPVQIDSMEMPYNGLWRDYLIDFVVYCSPGCSMREYSYLENQYPDSDALNGPVPESFSNLLVNH